MGAFQPGLYWGQHGPFVIKVINKLCSKKGAWAGLSFDQFHQDREELIGVSPIGGNEPVRPEIGNLAFSQVQQGSSGKLLDVFDQRDTQHLGDGPEFNDR